jgi:hypothetical protein
MGFEKAPVSVDAGQVKLGEAAADALEDLTAHPAKPRPSQPQARQRPFQERVGPDVGHRLIPREEIRRFSIGRAQ